MGTKLWYLVRMEPREAAALSGFCVDGIICKAARVEVQEILDALKGEIKRELAPEGELERGHDLTAEIPGGRR